ncbi:hypothetical protein MA16_Dca022787 [Dendrobium catenatum]|uniref:Uncharacterized protein n=1 Tax=Dendrobium catenatum TaxID=906689 RepID=A0A2I0X3X7_9ASPA|nr:hypothetical protein MA16_Dca022787 [Dendrobium catenatum]
MHPNDSYLHNYNYFKVPLHVHYKLYTHRYTKRVNTIKTCMGPGERVIGTHMTSRDVAWVIKVESDPPKPDR